MTLGVSISVCDTKIKKCVLPIFQTLLALISGLNSSPVKSWIFSKFMGVNWGSTSVPLRTCFIRIATKLVMLLCQPRTQSNFNKTAFSLSCYSKKMCWGRGWLLCLIITNPPCSQFTALLTLYCWPQEYWEGSPRISLAYWSLTTSLSSLLLRTKPSSSSHLVIFNPWKVPWNWIAFVMPPAFHKRHH